MATSEDMKDLAVACGALDSAKEHVEEGSPEHLEIALDIIRAQTGRLRKMRNRWAERATPGGGE